MIEKDRWVYDFCLKKIADAWNNDELEPYDLEPLQNFPTIFNLLEQLCLPEEVLLLDSEWHAEFFSGDLDQALCKFEH